MTASTFARAAELEPRAGRSRSPRSWRSASRPPPGPGASGIVHPDGTIEGWVGGSCAQPVVVREALRALADGQPRLLRLSRDGPGEGRRADGVIELVMTCHSGGTLEIYVEPHLPAPHLWVVGTTPDRRRARPPRRGRRLAGDAHRPDRRARRLPGRARVHASADIRGLDPEASPYVVVASQGIWDEEAVGLALTREASYVGLVASPTRAGVVRDWLREETTIGDERIAALRAPAGLDLGAETAEEIALSILAELVQVRRGRADFVASPGPATVAGGLPEPITLEPVVDDIVLTDPVCGMTVDRAHARHLAEHDGVVYAFCSIGCRTRFIKEPASTCRPTAVTRRRYPCPTDADRARRTRMHFEGSVDIAAPRDRVWAFVTDPNQVGQCGPGVESIEVIDDTHFKATAKVGIGFISARFVVNMEFAELTAPDAATIKAHGQAPGSAVDATPRCACPTATDGGTTMDWKADVNIAGTLASVGARLIEGTANKMIGQTFDCMKSKLESGRLTPRPARRDLCGPVTRRAGVGRLGAVLAVAADDAAGALGEDVCSAVRSQ